MRFRFSPFGHLHRLPRMQQRTPDRQLRSHARRHLMDTWEMVASLKFGVLVSSLVLLAACSSSAQQPRRSGQTPVAQSATDVVATVAGTRITLAQVDARALQMPASNFGNMKLSQALYAARRAALDDIIGDALIDREAKARGIESEPR